MKALQSVSYALQYLWDGALRIFSPNRDEYPATGVLPYDGDPTKATRHSR
ncbi:MULTISPECIES: hypothetical protein [unclassified Leptolyngbya]|nr:MULTISPECIES: hypothetical protein [unclassified Leptolyngbya]MBD1914007.1 hypothetical protein [Leptolyngbya sp. FACHB-8]MBD2154265.1 hypothetical protein [Leptolyngbya sp. FACHB-16]